MSLEDKIKLYKADMILIIFVCCDLIILLANRTQKFIEEDIGRTQNQNMYVVLNFHFGNRDRGMKKCEYLQVNSMLMDNKQYRLKIGKYGTS